MNLERLLNQPCPKHGTQDKPATHLWKDCFIMREFKNSDLFRYDHGPSGGSGPGFHGPVMVEVTPVQVFRVTKVDRVIKAIRATKVVIINRGISNSSSQIIRVTQSS